MRRTKSIERLSRIRAPHWAARIGRDRATEPASPTSRCRCAATGGIERNGAAKGSGRKVCGNQRFCSGGGRWWRSVQGGGGG